MANSSIILIGEYSYPRSYSFVAPHGVGTSLSNLLKNPIKLKEGLLENWDKLCKDEITKTGTGQVILDSELLEYIDKLDFSIFTYIPPLMLIEQHQASPYHVARFGGGLPSRPSIPSPPESPSDNEVVYISKLLDAYNDHSGSMINSSEDLQEYEELNEHYKDSRVEFYSAEALRSFSRDTLPPEVYDQLQDEIHSGIRDEIRTDHKDGYIKVLAVVKTARTLQLTSNALIQRIHVRDKGGICHQLANERDDVQWVKK